MPDYYQMLGIDPTASRDEIKTAYKKLALALHPDRNPGNSTAEETFKQINEAYQVLSHPERRAEYDLRRHFADQEPAYTYPEYQAPPPRRTYSYSGRPRYAPRVEFAPGYERKMYFILGMFFALFAAGSVWFYHYMNRVAAEQHYEEALAEGKTYGALLKYSEAIGFDKEFWQAYYKRGELRISVLGDYRHAYYDFSAAIHYAEKPTSDMYYNRGLCSLQQNNYAEALIDFNQAIALNAGNGRAYYLRSLTYLQIKDRARACMDWKRAAALGVSFPEDSISTFCR